MFLLEIETETSPAVLLKQGQDIYIISKENAIIHSINTNTNTKLQFLGPISFRPLNKLSKIVNNRLVLGNRNYFAVVCLRSGCILFQSPMYQNPLVFIEFDGRLAICCTATNIAIWDIAENTCINIDEDILISSLTYDTSIGLFSVGTINGNVLVFDKYGKKLDVTNIVKTNDISIIDQITNSIRALLHLPGLIFACKENGIIIYTEDLKQLGLLSIGGVSQSKIYDQKLHAVVVEGDSIYLKVYQINARKLISPRKRKRRKSSIVTDLVGKSSSLKSLFLGDDTQRPKKRKSDRRKRLSTTKESDDDLYNTDIPQFDLKKFRRHKSVPLSDTGNDPNSPRSQSTRKSNPSMPFEFLWIKKNRLALYDFMESDIDPNLLPYIHFYEKYLQLKRGEGNIFHLCSVYLGYKSNSDCLLDVDVDTVKLICANVEENPDVASLFPVAALVRKFLRERYQQYVQTKVTKDDI
eukprot:TRINITY_DN2643_c0_g1_i1.p1 TRINITY_DN2643_c0_g1~~TRINITY_DN2643_c0_g1_i1.p1  ORF type:complete len:467 (-),score=92.30 TRINITY_DN2643_c0_g1_i1:46-1446(-)